MGFEFEIQYRMGASNQVADALSRKGLDAEMQNMEVGCWKHWNKLREEMAFISRVKKELEVDCNSHREFSLYQGNLYYKNRLIETRSLSVIFGWNYSGSMEFPSRKAQHTTRNRMAKRNCHVYG